MQLNLIIVPGYWWSSKACIFQNAVFKAMYDYDAADEDEVSFRDGDIIINPEPIDDGWMYGTVQRSGHTGMLPSNYVERIQ